jgi:hypothetical protein
LRELRSGSGSGRGSSEAVVIGAAKGAPSIETVGGTTGAEATVGRDWDCGEEVWLTAEVKALESGSWLAAGAVDEPPEPSAAAATSRIARDACWLADSGLSVWVEPEFNGRIRTTTKPMSSTAALPEAA